jgi:heme/copper-type cytochrome/quinol oxidase subunit 2
MTGTTRTPVRPGSGLIGRKPEKLPPAVWAASLAKTPKEEPPPARRRTVLGLAFRIVPAIALVAVSVVLYMVWQDKNGLADEQQKRQELATAAKKVANTFFNWDYQHMQQSFAAKYPLLTKKAADAIRPTAGTLTSYFTENKASSKASISGVYAGEIKGRNANVMVVINTRVVTSKTIQSNNGATVALSMTLEKGRWLAGNITLLSSGAHSATDEKGKPLSGDEKVPGVVPGD